MCAMTVQRQLIFDIIKDSHEHLTADQIFCTAKEKMPTIVKVLTILRFETFQKKLNNTIILRFYPAKSISTIYVINVGGKRRAINVLL